MTEELVLSAEPPFGGRWVSVISSTIRNPSGRFGAFLVVVLVIAVLVGPVLYPYDPGGGSLADRLQMPSSSHWMGTDLLGRDVLSRVLTGGRLTLGIGLLSVIIGFVVGCSMASVGVIGGRYVDGLIMRLVDVLLAFPSILLAIAVIAALGQGVPQLMVAIGVAQIGNFARLLRSRLVAVQQADFIVASQAIGAGRSRILLRHLLPNALTPVLVYSPLALATAISSIASLGFLGLGPSDPSTPEWGSMLSDAAQYLRQGPQLLLFPGAAIVATILGFNLLGDALREAVDPRRRT